jgi:phytoene dehydrogenase-like protein
LIRDYDAIVIGGGVAGLSTASLLGLKYGRRALVLERSPVLGGRARTTEKEGYVLDYGLHSHRLAENGKAAEVMRSLGKDIEFAHGDDPSIYWNGGLITMPIGLLSLLRTSMLSWRSKLKALGVMQHILSARPENFANVSLYDYLKRFNARWDLMDFLTLYAGAGLICSDINVISTGEFMAFVQGGFRAKETAAPPRGSWRTTIDNLKGIVEGHGEIRVGVAATRIIAEGGIVSGVMMGDVSLSAPAVVYTGNPRDLPPLIDRLPQALTEKLVSLEPTAGISLDFALSRSVSEAKGLILTMHPLTMGYFRSNMDHSVAPPGGVLGTWFYPLPSAELKDRGRARDALDLLKGLLATIFPGIWGYVKWERTLFADVVDGAMPRVGQTRWDRPDFFVEGVKGLFLAGDWTRGRGEGSDIAFDSALLCSEAINAYLAEMT